MEALCGRATVALLPGAAPTRETMLPPDAACCLIDKHGKSQYFGLFGEPRVNVLALNLALDPRP